VGIGFLTFDGVLYGTKIDRDTPFSVVDQGIGTIFNNGQDFTCAGAGFATGVGRFDSAASSIPGPFHAAFVGFVDGRMVLSSSFETVWPLRGGDQIRLSGVEFISLAVVTLPDGTQVPDSSQTRIPELYCTVEGGTGRFRNAQSLYFAKPKKENGGPANHANHAKPKGVAEAEPALQKGELVWTLEFSLNSSPFACFRVVSGQSIPLSRLREPLHPPAPTPLTPSGRDWASSPAIVERDRVYLSNRGHI
jgi:hypothetical protein